MEAQVKNGDRSGEKNIGPEGYVHTFSIFNPKRHFLHHSAVQTTLNEKLIVPKDLKSCYGQYPRLSYKIFVSDHHGIESGTRPGGNNCLKAKGFKLQIGLEN